MTRWRLQIIVLAAVAALMVAPSSASAAPPNQLHAPAVTPLDGGPSTIFTFSVRYVSTGGNPAFGVTATAGGRTVALTLVSGNATDGTWSGTSTLPPGTWTVRFRATADRGPSPQATGPTVSVTTPPTPEPPGGGGGGGKTTSLPPEPSAPAVAPTQPGGNAAAPSLDAAPVPGSTVPSPSQGAGTTADPPVGDPPGTTGGVTGTGGGGGQSVSGGAGTPAPGSTGAAPASSGGSAPAATAANAPGATAAAGSVSGPSPRDMADRALVWTVLAIGLVGVSAVGLLGVVWVLRGRDEEEDEPVPASVTPAPTKPDDAIAPLLQQRMMRRARMRSSEDPILAAMGLDEPREQGAAEPKATAPSRSRAGQVGVGPGERETYGGRRGRGG